jgi:hypothetical protein
MVRLGRWLRGWRPDRNPLRRTCDRVETYLLAGLFAALAAAAPFAGQAASHAAYAGALRAQRAELATSHQVRAELTELAGYAYSGYTVSGYVPALATWTSAAGVRHTVQVMAPAGSKKGGTVTVWADSAGNPVSPPLLTSQVSGDGQAAALGAIAGLGAFYLAAAAAARGAANRRRMAAWDADWLVTAPVWNRQRW